MLQQIIDRLNAERAELVQQLCTLRLDDPDYPAVVDAIRAIKAEIRDLEHDKVIQDNN